MQLNIAHKIFGIAIVVLVLMVGVAFFSVSLTEEISEELDVVANKQLPLSETIGLINVDVLEHGMLLQELFNLPESAPDAVKRIEKLNHEINESFAKANALFNAVEHSDFTTPAVIELHQALKNVEREYRDIERHSEELLALHANGHDQKFHDMLVAFDEEQTHLDTEIADIRRRVERMADEAVIRADEDEKFLLVISIVLTLLALIISMGVAILITQMLVKNVRNLVSAAEAVENGDLDVEVPIVTQDEVGKLTASFNEMVSGLRMKERIKDTFGKYMDPRLVSRLLDNPELTQLGGDRHEMTVMFIDLQGYTSISEKLPPADLVNMLNMFLAHMTDAISEKSGVVNDFLGDAVMAYWGPPFTSEDEHAALACKAALEASKRFELFCSEVSVELGSKADGLELGMRIGISTGEMVAGNIGSKTTRKYSVIGDPVNLGARLESANKNYGTQIILSDRTYELAVDEVEARELDVVRVKGKDTPTRIYELLSTKVDHETFAKGLAAYRSQNWPLAEDAFRACISTNASDPVPYVFLDRIKVLKSTPLDQNWDGVWQFATK
ncbi:MAG: HAMP domain-containing protein [Magnetovibrio sp.]|nr:HAMP domain-containing protein [Magnetovibrio sp.]